jgi:hypothetical protein
MISKDLCLIFKKALLKLRKWKEQDYFAKCNEENPLDLLLKNLLNLKTCTSDKLFCTEVGWVCGHKQIHRA